MYLIISMLNAFLHLVSVLVEMLLFFFVCFLFCFLLAQKKDLSTKGSEEKDVKKRDSS